MGTFAVQQKQQFCQHKQFHHCFLCSKIHCAWSTTARRPPHWQTHFTLHSPNYLALCLTRVNTAFLQSGGINGLCFMFLWVSMKSTFGSLVIHYLRCACHCAQGIRSNRMWVTTYDTPADSFRNTTCSIVLAGAFFFLTWCLFVCPMRLRCCQTC